MSIGLTPRQNDVLLFVETRLEKTGVAPSYVEIAAHLGLKSKSAAHRLMHALEERGRIRMLPKRARAVEIVTPAERCPHCGFGLGSVACRANAAIEKSPNKVVQLRRGARA